MDVCVDITGSEGDEQERIADLARFALTRLEVPVDCELSISFVSADEIRKLNDEYRDTDRPTDVLSFPCDDAWEAAEDGPTVLLGDIVICPEIVAEHAAAYQTSLQDERDLMVVHGILHLLGYDHIEDEEAEKMEATEQEILGAYAKAGKDS